jgi:hypothetical protein
MGFAAYYNYIATSAENTAGGAARPQRVLSSNHSPLLRMLVAAAAAATDHWRLSPAGMRRFVLWSTPRVLLGLSGSKISVMLPPFAGIPIAAVTVRGHRDLYSDRAVSITLALLEQRAAAFSRYPAMCRSDSLLSSFAVPLRTETPLAITPHSTIKHLISVCQLLSLAFDPHAANLRGYCNLTHFYHSSLMSGRGR